MTILTTSAASSIRVGRPLLATLAESRGSARSRSTMNIATSNASLSLVQIVPSKTDEERVLVVSPGVGVRTAGNKDGAFLTRYRVNGQL